MTSVEMFVDDHVDIRLCLRVLLVWWFCMCLLLCWQWSIM